MKKHISFIFILFISNLIVGQTNNITVEEIWKEYKFYEKSIYGINWMLDGKYYSELEENKITQKNIENGKQTKIIFDGNILLPENIKIDGYSFSNNESQILIETETESIYRHSYKAKYYLYNTTSKSLTPLSKSQKIMFATLSPDGKKVAYVKENNLYYTNLVSMQEIQITNDGSWGKIINGWADWVYEEEFGEAIAFKWAPDGSKIAYFKFDESNVKEYNMQIWGGLYPEDYKFKYPKAGEANAQVSVYCYDVATDKSVLLEDGSNKDQYIPRIFWTNSAAELLIFKLNRLQNHLQIIKTTTSSAEQKVILEEKNETYVEIYDDIRFVKDRNEFILASEKDGFKHLYLYNFEGKLINQITAGNWDVDNLQEIDSKNRIVYYTSAEISPMDRQLYSIQFDGKNKQQLTKGNGTHSINLSPDCSYYIDSYSKLNTPSTTSLFLTKGNKKLNVLEDNAMLNNLLAPYNLSKQELFKFKTTDNIELNGWMIKPANFNADKKYPVLMFVYGGPGSQTVNDNWGGQNYMWYQLLAQKGYIVVSVDGRGTGFRGANFKKSTYAKLGELETKDQIEGAKYLGNLPYVDKTRIGIWGWSFGGYMTSLCLTVGAEYFKTGVAVAPVTSWRFYDSIYTERFLGLPKANAKGYDDNSPLNHTDKLKGNYFIIHGTGDDNVHFQNAVEMEDALIKSNKQFKSFYYPNRNHGIYGGVTRLHLYNMMTDYILNNL